MPVRGLSFCYQRWVGVSVFPRPFVYRGRIPTRAMCDRRSSQQPISGSEVPVYRSGLSGTRMAHAPVTPAFAPLRCISNVRGSAPGRPGDGSNRPSCVPWPYRLHRGPDLPKWQIAGIEPTRACTRSPSVPARERTRPRPGRGKVRVPVHAVSAIASYSSYRVARTCPRAMPSDQSRRISRRASRSELNRQRHQIRRRQITARSDRWHNSDRR
jgi:hypothetical protein